MASHIRYDSIPCSFVYREGNGRIAVLYGKEECVASKRLSYDTHVHEEFYVYFGKITEYRYSVDISFHH